MQRGGRPSRQTRRTISRGTVETFIFTFPFRRAMNKCKGSKSEATRSLFLFRYASSLNLMARCYFRSTLSSMHTHTHTHMHVHCRAKLKRELENGTRRYILRSVRSSIDIECLRDISYLFHLSNIYIRAVYCFGHRLFF